MYFRSSTDVLRSRVVGLGAYLPERVVRSEELEAKLTESGLSITKGVIAKTTGVESRRVASSEENASDLATAATRSALADAGVEPGAVDLLIFAAASHDITEPATANIVQTKLGLANAETYDVKNACNSFMSGLNIADAYIRSGMARTVVVATGELPSRACDSEYRSQEELTESFSQLTMGDAGGAVVVTASEEQGCGILASAGVTKGEHWRLGTILSGGTMFPHDLSRDKAFLRSRGRELEACGRREVPPVLSTLFEQIDWTPDSIDVVATQQHTRRIIAEIMDSAAIPLDRVAMPLTYAGNTVSANIPLSLVDARDRGQLKPGSRTLLLGGSSGFTVVAIAACW